MATEQQVIVSVQRVYKKSVDGSWHEQPVSETAQLAARIAQLYRSVRPQDVQEAVDLKTRWARRLGRYEARKNSAPGRRRARGTHD